MKFFLCVFGMVMVVEGLPYFAFPGKMKEWMSTIKGIPDNYLRVIGLVAMCIGLLIAYVFRT